MSGPKEIAVGPAVLKDPERGDLVVDIAYSGISTGTEKLFWLGTMPAFPGMGYPLVPGYESYGEVVEAGADTGFRPGDHVFVPGSNCFGEDLRGLFGGATSRLVTPANRAVRLDAGAGPRGALLALAATARHALAGFDTALPELIIGHGTLGRLLARLTLAAGGKPPTVWEVDAGRHDGAQGYEVLCPEDDPRRDYRSIYDASGAPDLLDSLVGRLARGGEIVLCGFYSRPLSFAFPPAFMKEMRLRIASEWQPADMVATRALVEGGALSLDGLITHHRPGAEAPSAYRTAFEDSGCLKMILDWKVDA
jgi:3-hydroxyethyl bacteriochlorophyllide a dehydrogenase